MADVAHGPDRGAGTHLSLDYRDDIGECGVYGFLALILSIGMVVLMYGIAATVRPVSAIW